MRVGYMRGDLIKYHLMGYEGRIETVFAPNKEHDSYMSVSVLSSTNPEIAVGTTQYISYKGYKHIEILSNDMCVLTPTEAAAVENLFTFFQENAKENGRKFLIDQALSKRDKRSFLELTGGDAQ